MSRQFLGRNTVKLSKLGRGRPKIQRWRAANGRHSKIRKNRFGYTKSPRIGFKTEKTESGKINGKMPFLITQSDDFSKVTKENILILSRRIGAKKKIEFIKKANDMGFVILNVGGKHGSN
ncbi:MAG: eL32 family ribosomal protein [Candidatus Pacearchaeota archaeon]